MTTNQLIAYNLSLPVPCARTAFADDVLSIPELASPGSLKIE
jgi:hypothetical protein